MCVHEAHSESGGSMVSYLEQKLCAWDLRYSNLRYPDGFPTTAHLQTHPHSHPVNKHIIVLYMLESV